MLPNEPNDRHPYGFIPRGRMIASAVLIAFGALFLLSNLGIIPRTNPGDYWPVILIVIGAFKLADSDRRGGFVPGAILLGMGVVFLVGNLGILETYLHIELWQLWPLALIGVGVLLLFERLTWGDRIHDSLHGRGQACGWGAPFTGNDLNLTAVFSGGKRKIVSDDFRGGVISAVFGGFELDLRGANMKADSATLKIDAVFGGAEIKIPETWCAVVQGAGIFGGYSDDTHHPPMTPETKRLYVRGGAVFGGVVVKN